MNGGQKELDMDHKLIMAGPPVTCPCGEIWYSPFDKVYVTTYKSCVVCTDPKEFEEKSLPILNLISE